MVSRVGRQSEADSATALAPPYEELCYLWGQNHFQTGSFGHIVWSELCSYAEQPVEIDKHAARIFAPHDASAKTKDAVLSHNHMTMIVGDIDQGNLSRKDLQIRLQALGIESYLIYSTASHQVGGNGNRWRVCVQITRGLDVVRWKMLQACLAVALGGDDCTGREQQIFYAPNRGPVEYRFHVENGAALDPLDEDHPFVMKAQELQKKQADELAEIERSGLLPAPSKSPYLSKGQMSPIDTFNQVNAIEEILAVYGYQKRGIKWLYPGSKNAPGVVLLKGGRYFSHHASDPLSDGYTHDAFDLFMWHEHGGNFDAAIKAAGEDLKTVDGISISRHNRRIYARELERNTTDQRFDQDAGAICELAPLNVLRMINTQALPREFLFRDPDGEGVIKEGIGAGMAAPGGTGKSTVLLDMAYAMAIGGKWLGHYKATNPRKAFFFTAEDGADEIHHRISVLHHQYIQECLPSDEHAKEIEILLEENLKIFCISGLPFSLTITDVSRGYARGSGAQKLVDIINHYGGSGLVIIDPLRKLAAGNEGGEAMTQVIATCDWIREQTTGTTTTFLAHHSSQAAQQSVDDSSAAFRGATDLVDGLRWTMVMQMLSGKEAKNLGINPMDRIFYRRYSFPKSNYSVQKFSQYLHYDNGTFRYVQMVSQKVQDLEEVAENAMHGLCMVLDQLEGTGEPVSKKCIMSHCKAKPLPEERGAVIPIGKNQKTVEALLQKAKAGGLIEAYQAMFPGNKRMGEAWRLTKEGRKFASLAVVKKRNTDGFTGIKAGIK